MSLRWRQASASEAVTPRERHAANRIAPVDGLRAIAALGVLWAHVWAFTGNPQLPLARIGPVVLDANRAFAIVGTGVDLFFVIRLAKCLVPAKEFLEVVF